jgi:hypothetical protein
LATKILPRPAGQKSHKGDSALGHQIFNHLQSRSRIARNWISDQVRKLVAKPVALDYR